MQCNCFIYFGIIASEGDLRSAMRNMHKKNDIDAFIFGNNLQYQKIGNAKASSRYIIGKEIYHQYAFTAMNIQYDEKHHISLLDQNGKAIKIFLDKQDEQEITKKIYSLGFFNLTGYHLIHNYEINEI